MYDPDLRVLNVELESLGSLLELGILTTELSVRELSLDDVSRGDCGPCLEGLAFLLRLIALTGNLGDLFLGDLPPPRMTREALAMSR